MKNYAIIIHLDLDRDPHLRHQPPRTANMKFMVNLIT